MPTETPTRTGDEARATTEASAGADRRRWHAELAWSPTLGLRRDVLIEAIGDRFTAVTPEAKQAMKAWMNSSG